MEYVISTLDRQEQHESYDYRRSTFYGGGGISLCPPMVSQILVIWSTHSFVPYLGVDVMLAILCWHARKKCYWTSPCAFGG